MYLNPSMLDQVICGDCLTVLPTLPAASIDFVLTDPPYLVNYRSRDGRSYPNDDNDAWLAPAFAEIARVLKPNRFCVSFYGWNRADRFLAAWKAAGLQPVGHLVWVKRYHSKERFVRYAHESAYLLAKGNPPKPRLILRDVLTEWRYTGDTLHPTQKPVAALLPLILSFSEPRDIVLDPFAGSGSTAVAAKILGRRYVAIELSEQYARIARDRLRSGAYRTM
jgi:adenine-specific DNA-methyltransferase